MLSVYLSVLGLIGVLVTGYVFYRKALGDVADKASAVWERTAEGWKARAEQLETLNAEYIGRIAQLEAKVAELERRPDLDMMQAGLASLGLKLDDLVTLQKHAAVEVEGVRVKAKEAAGLVEDVRLQQSDAAIAVAEAAKHVEEVRAQQVIAAAALLEAAAKLKAETETPLPVVTKNGTQH